MNGKLDEGKYLRLWEVDCLKKYDNVIVTGPQRSGTRITAKIISDICGFEYVDEVRISVANTKIIKQLLVEKKGCVFQAPGMSSYSVELSKGNVVIVFVFRDVQDIIKSQERIHWMCEGAEKDLYPKMDGCISEMKYKYFIEKQERKIEHSFRIRYDDLAGHRFFLKKDKRSNFLWDQTGV